MIIDMHGRCAPSSIVNEKVMDHLLNINLSSQYNCLVILSTHGRGVKLCVAMGTS